MKSFINVEDIGPLEKAMAEAMEIKQDRYKKNRRKIGLPKGGPFLFEKRENIA